MKNNLIHEFIGRIYETRFKNNFKEELINSSFIREMDERLLEKIVKLDDYDFNYYLSFLYKIYIKNNNINYYQDKLLKITNLLIPRLGNINTNILIDILINTNLIDKEYIVKFSRLLLNTKETDEIVDLVYNKDINDRNFDIIINSLINSKSDIERDFIITLTNNKRIITKETELIKALDFLNKTKYEDKLIAFSKLFIFGDLKDLSLYSEYSMLIEDAIVKSINKDQLITITKIGIALKASRFKNSIIKQILKSKNKYALKEYNEIFKIPNIINDNKILDILELLNKVDNEGQLVVINKLLNINPDNILSLINEVLQHDNIRLLYVNNYLDKVDNLLIKDIDLFKIVLDIKDDYKYDFLMKILNYKNILSNNNLKVIKDFFKVKEKYKYIALDKYINNNLNNKEFRLDSNYSNNIIMLLKSTKKDFQANTLIRVSNIIKEDKYNLLVKATFVKYEAVGILYGDLLETNIINDSRFLDILHNFETCDNLCGQLGMVELAKNKRLRTSMFLTGYFMMMKRFININQVGVLLRILDNYPDLDDYNLFKYCEKIMFVTNKKLLLMLEKLIINNKKLDKETIDLCILEINKHNTYENIKFIEEYLRDDKKIDVSLESEIDIEEGIEMLNRQKLLDLNPNSVLTYKKIRSSK